MFRVAVHVSYAERDASNAMRDVLNVAIAESTVLNVLDMIVGSSLLMENIKSVRRVNNQIVQVQKVPRASQAPGALQVRVVLGSSLCLENMPRLLLR